MRRFQIVALVCGLTVLAASALAQDYGIQPVPANFTQDSNTTFLVNLTTAKTQADYAVGNSTLTLNATNFVAGAGYTGPIGFNTAGNWPTNAWTLEMLILVPFESGIIASNNPIGLLDWENDSVQCNFYFELDGNGVSSRMYSWNSGNGSFVSGPHAGGNTYTVQASASDKWVYIGVGCDFSNRLYMTAAREVSGAILNSNINFVPTPGQSNSAAAWAAMQGYFSAGMPGSITLGSNLVQIQAIKISNVYKTNLFSIAALLPQANATNWIPATLDPTRATNQTVLRNVGYPGYNNYVSMLVNESYLPVAPGSPSFSIQLTNVPIGLYTYYLFGQIAPNGRTSLNQVWKPCMMNFMATDAGGTILGQGQMPIKEYLSPNNRQMGFQFHLDTQTTNVTLTFSVPTNSVETPWIYWISMFDDLAGLPDVAIKNTTTLFSGGATNQDTTLTTARMQRDDMIWNAVSLLNFPIQVSPNVTEFEQPPTNGMTHTWITKAFNGVSDYNYQYYTFSNLDLLDTNTGVTFPASSVLSTNAWPSPFPEYPVGVFQPVQLSFVGHGYL